MKPRTRPSMTTWGRMPKTSCQSISAAEDRAGRGGGGWGGAGRAPPRARTSGRPLLLLGRRRCDLQTLDQLVVLPVLGDLVDQVGRLLGVTLVVELDVAGDPGVLDLPGRLADG